MTTNEFQRLLLQNAAFTPPCHIVSTIPKNTRTLRIPNVPHSIAEELWHIQTGLKPRNEFLPLRVTKGIKPPPSQFCMLTGAASRTLFNLGRTGLGH